MNVKLEEILPLEIMPFLDQVIPYLDYYQNHALSNDCKEFQNIPKSYQIPLIIIYTLLGEKDYKNILKKHGFCIEQFEGIVIIRYSYAHGDIIYNYICKQILPKEMIEYVHLTPTDILINHIEKIPEGDRETFIYEKLNDLKNELITYNTQDKKYAGENLSEEVQEYLTTILANHQNFQNIFVQEDEKQIFTLLISVFCLKNQEMSQFLEFIGISKENIFQYLKKQYSVSSVVYSKMSAIERQEYFHNKFTNFLLDNIKMLQTEMSCDTSMVISNLLSKKYDKYIFEGNNQGKAINKITVLDIISNLFHPELTESELFSKYLKEIGLVITSKERLDELYYNFQIELEKKQMEEKTKKIIESYTKEMQSYFESALSMDKKIRLSLEIGKGNRELLKDDQDITALSLTLALYQHPYKHLHFFQEKGITFESIIGACGLEWNNQTTEEEFDYKKFYQHYRNYCFDQYYYIKREDGKIQTSCYIEAFVKRLFDEKINENSILKQITEHLGIDYKVLATEVIHEKPYIETLSLEEKIEYLSHLSIPKLDSNQIENFLSFGNQLTKHISLIQNDISALTLSETSEKTIETVLQISSNVSPEESKRNLLERWLKRSNSQTINSINIDMLKTLQKAIEENRKVLSKEMLGYEKIRKYIEIYLRKSYEHYKMLEEVIDNLNENINQLDFNQEENFVDLLNSNMQIQRIQRKLNTFATTSQVMKQNLIFVHQRINTHYILVDVLERAQYVLIPLMLSKIAIYKEMETEKSGVQLVKIFIHLFQNMLSENVNEVMKNMNELESLQITPQEIASLDMDTYLKNIEQLQVMNQQIKAGELPVIDNEHHYVKKEG